MWENSSEHFSAHHETNFNVHCHRKRLQATNQRVLQLSRESLLSLSSKMVLHEATRLRERNGAGSEALIRLDVQTTAVCSITATEEP